MLCEQCQRDSKTSTIRFTMKTVTSLPTDYYYDELGRYHYHNPNKDETTYKCSNGHIWVEEERESRCEVCQPFITVADVEKGFAAGEKLSHRDGRRVIAVHPPGYFESEDGDSLLVQFEGKDYGGDFWEEVQASNLRRLEAVNVPTS